MSAAPIKSQDKSRPTICEVEQRHYKKAEELIQEFRDSHCSHTTLKVISTCITTLLLVSVVAAALFPFISSWEPWKMWLSLAGFHIAFSIIKSKIDGRIEANEQGQRIASLFLSLQGVNGSLRFLDESLLPRDDRFKSDRILSLRNSEKQLRSVQNAINSGDLDYASSIAKIFLAGRIAHDPMTQHDSYKGLQEKLAKARQLLENGDFEGFDAAFAQLDAEALSMTTALGDVLLGPFTPNWKISPKERMQAKRAFIQYALADECERRKNEVISLYNQGVEKYGPVASANIGKSILQALFNQKNEITENSQDLLWRIEKKFMDIEALRQEMVAWINGPSAAHLDHSSHLAKVFLGSPSVDDPLTKTDFYRELQANLAQAKQNGNSEGFNDIFAALFGGPLLFNWTPSYQRRVKAKIEFEQYALGECDRQTKAVIELYHEGVKKYGPIAANDPRFEKPAFLAWLNQKNEMTEHSRHLLWRIEKKLIEIAEMHQKVEAWIKRHPEEHLKVIAGYIKQIKGKIDCAECEKELLVLQNKVKEWPQKHAETLLQDIDALGQKLLPLVIAVQGSSGCCSAFWHDFKRIFQKTTPIVYMPLEEEIPYFKEFDRVVFPKVCALDPHPPGFEALCKEREEVFAQLEGEKEDDFVLRLVRLRVRMEDFLENFHPSLAKRCREKIQCETTGADFFALNAAVREVEIRFSAGKLKYFEASKEFKKILNSFGSKEKAIVHVPPSQKRRELISIHTRMRGMDSSILTTYRASRYGIRWLAFTIMMIVASVFSSPWVGFGISCGYLAFLGVDYFLERRIAVLQKKKNALKMEEHMVLNPHLHYVKPKHIEAFRRADALGIDISRKRFASLIASN